MDIPLDIKHEEVEGGFPGLLVDGVFWHWQKDITSTGINHEAGVKRVRKVEKWVGFGFGVFGFIIFGLGAAMNGYGSAIPLQSAFIEPNGFGLLLAIGVLGFLFAAYVTVKESEVGRMVPLLRGDKPEKLFVGSLDEIAAKANIAEVCDADAQTTIADAFMLAERSGTLSVNAIHILVATFSTVPGQVFLARLGITLENLKDPLRRRLSREEKGPTVFGRAAEGIIVDAFAIAVETRRRQLSSLDLFAAAMHTDSFFAELFEEQGIKSEELENALAWMRISQDLQDRYKNFKRAASLKPTGNMDRAMTAVATPFLDSVSEDLTRDAVYGRTGLLVGREQELAAVFRAIEGGNKSVVLVGQAGVGKGAIIEGIADLMVEERVPRILEDKRLLRLSIPHIVSAQGGTGAEERFLYALQEVGKTGNVVLVIENIHELVGQGAGIDLASILATELERGYTFVIATTTPDGYATAVERSVLGSKLSHIAIDEPERNDAIRIVEAKINAIENKNGVIFTYGAVAAAVDLSSRYMHEGVLPLKAIELAREVALVVGKRDGKMPWVKKADVAALVSEKTKIPVTEVTENEGAKLLALEDKIHERVIGQEDAIKAVASALRRARAELRSEGRPIANFLFLGPTGVGKTELAKATAEVFFGNEQVMVRFDMSEYQNKESVTRLIGGNGEPGLMTEAIRRNPFSLLLLDELEKASPDILNLFLQVMDDGRLTDGLGRTVDFTNVILIATSNAGTQYIQDEVAKGTSLPLIKDALMNSELRQLFRPEFLNRFNDVIVFSPLTEADVTAIAYLMLAKVQKRFEAKSMVLEITDAAIHELARAGYDPKFGARPLRRVIEERVENVLADELLRGKITRRDTVIFDVGGKIEVKKAQSL